MRRQLEIRSVVDQVHAELLERIVAGELAPGSRLRQEALADELGVPLLEPHEMPAMTARERGKQRVALEFERELLACRRFAVARQVANALSRFMGDASASTPRKLFGKAAAIFTA